MTDEQFERMNKTLCKIGENLGYVSIQLMFIFIALLWK